MGRAIPLITLGLQHVLQWGPMGRVHLILFFFSLRARGHGTLQIPLLQKKVESMDAAATTAAAGDEEDQARLEAIAEGLQNRDAMRLYNWVSQRCFSDCVVTFYRKSLGKGEADCVRACVRKYLLLTTASAARFADISGAASSGGASDDY